MGTAAITTLLKERGLCSLENQILGPSFSRQWQDLTIPYSACHWLHFLIFFGQSMYAYAMTVSLVYGTAAYISVGCLVALVLSDRPRLTVFAAFAATAVVAATRTAGWLSTRQHYPDIGNALVLSLWLIAAILLLRRPTALKIGTLVFLTFAVLLFRRHLLFAWGAAGLGTRLRGSHQVLGRSAVK